MKALDWKKALDEEAEDTGADIKDITTSVTGNITRKSVVTFICACGSECKVNIRGCVSIGGTYFHGLKCVNCRVKIKPSIPRNINWLEHLMIEQEVTGAKIKHITNNENGNITRESTVTGNCQCGLPFKRCARNCVPVGGGAYIGLCCRKCTNRNRLKKRIDTSRKKYDHDYATQSPQVKKKQEDTMMKRFGKKTNLLHPETQRKIEETCMERHGVRTPTEAAQLPEAIAKREETTLKNHGVRNIFEDKEYIRDCTEKKTGYRHNTQRPEIKEKIKNTNTERYGSPCALQNSEVQKKTKATYIRKTGYDHHMKTPEYKKKLKEKMTGSREDFIKKAKIKHNNINYSYEPVNYISARHPVTITCLIEGHGDFEQTPNTHLSGSGCPNCAKESAALKRVIKHSITKDEVIKDGNLIHNNIYSYELLPDIITRPTTTKQPFICIKHGTFYQTPYDHIKLGHGCPDCARENRGLARRNSQDAIIERFKKVHNIVKYKYDKVDYDGIDKNVLIGCSNDKHGYFSQTPSHHLQGNGCPKCVLKTESKFHEWLILNKEELKIKNIYWRQKENRPQWASFKKPPHNGSYYEYDFIIITQNNDKIIIEIDGDQHFRQVQNWASVLFTQVRDKIKELLAFKNECHFLRLNQMDIYYNKNHWEDATRDLFKYVENNEETEIIYMNEAGCEKFMIETGDFRSLIKHHEYKYLLYDYYNNSQGYGEGEGAGEGAGEGRGEGASEGAGEGEGE